jgi:predicted ArsR family transcriptional regulator
MEKHYPKRAAARLQQKARTRKEIAAFFKKHRYASQTDCAAALGLSKTTVFRHVKALREAEDRRGNPT